MRTHVPTYRSCSACAALGNSLIGHHRIFNYQSLSLIRLARAPASHVLRHPTCARSGRLRLFLNAQRSVYLPCFLTHSRQVTRQPELRSRPHSANTAEDSELPPTACWTHTSLGASPTSTFFRTIRTFLDCHYPPTTRSPSSPLRIPSLTTPSVHPFPIGVRTTQG